MTCEVDNIFVIMTLTEARILALHNAQQPVVHYEELISEPRCFVVFHMYTTRVGEKKLPNIIFLQFDAANL